MTWTSEQILQTIGKHMLNECVTNARLVDLTGLKKKQVEYATGKLKQNGFIKTVDQGCYRITQTGITAIEEETKLRSGPKGQYQTVRVFKDSLRTRVWRAIRISCGKSFSIPELAQKACKGNEKDAIANIGKYLRALQSAGYLIKMPKRTPGTAITSNGFARWRLDPLKDTGPHAPTWRMAKGTVFDPNTQEETLLLPLKREVD